MSIDQAKVRRESLRWLILLTLNNARSLMRALGVTAGYIQASQYLLGVQFGFEIWKAGGSDSFKVNSYSCSIN